MTLAESFHTARWCSWKTSHTEMMTRQVREISMTRHTVVSFWRLKLPTNLRYVDDSLICRWLIEFVEFSESLSSWCVDDSLICRWLTKFMQGFSDSLSSWYVDAPSNSYGVISYSSLVCRWLDEFVEFSDSLSSWNVDASSNGVISYNSLVFLKYQPYSHFKWKSGL